MQEQEQSPSILPTVGEIARANQVPIHRVEYAIKSLGIQPVARAGGLRVFGAADIQRIDELLGSRVKVPRGPSRIGGMS